MHLPISAAWLRKLVLFDVAAALAQIPDEKTLTATLKVLPELSLAMIRQGINLTTVARADCEASRIECKQLRGDLADSVVREAAAKLQLKTTEEAHRATQ